ncbi:MAG: tRNA (guanosine(46)-N7)-methyltransferase TrmB [Eubacteriales bacterium]|jgi:tRNA (guanine-N7-)-methyltransferase|nr:tRNA (guanosine(46)-N7)-methyltransferase TrmB [Clostridiales bacterium]
MRMRKKKRCAERLEACSDYIINHSSELEKKPYVLEIGCGKGGFIVEAAQREPDIPFLAMERVPDVLVVAAEKVKALGLSNVKLILGDASRLFDFIGEGEITRIYLNFSDPWPKKKHYKRRLTYRGFLEQYKRALVPGGEIRMKTDNSTLFEFSLEEFSACGFKLHSLTRDLHASEFAADNIITEYEENFLSKGETIKHVVAVLPKSGSGN